MCVSSLTLNHNNRIPVISLCCCAWRAKSCREVTLAGLTLGCRGKWLVRSIKTAKLDLCSDDQCSKLTWHEFETGFVRSRGVLIAFCGNSRNLELGGKRRRWKLWERIWKRRVSTGPWVGCCSGYPPSFWAIKPIHLYSYIKWHLSALILCSSCSVI